jgi:hypothetical protein
VLAEPQRVKRGNVQASKDLELNLSLYIDVVEVSLDCGESCWSRGHRPWANIFVLRHYLVPIMRFFMHFFGMILLV